MRGPDMESPPALGAEGLGIAVGANAAAHYAKHRTAGNSIPVPRAVIETTVATLIALLDRSDPDPDAEDGGDDEPDGDGEDTAWIEWLAMRGNQKGGHNRTAGHEDDEEDDAPEDDDPAGQCDEDGVNTEFAMARGGGPGCIISDPDAEDDGREQETWL